MYEDQVRYTWRSFENDSIQSRKEWFQRGQFADVTLVSDDMVPFPAHRIVLGSSSKLLNTLFEITNEPRQALFLKGVSGIHLESVLNFIYIGETSVTADKVEEFSKILRELGIEEFSNVNNPAHQLQKATWKADISSDLKSNLVEKLDFLSPLEENSELNEEEDKNLDIQDYNGACTTERSNVQTSSMENIDNKTEPDTDNINSFFKETAMQLLHYPTEDADMNLQHKAQVTEDYEVTIPSEETKLEGQKQLTEVQQKRRELYLRRKPEKPSECSVCARVFTTQRSMQRHHKIVHELHQVECEECGRKFSGRDSLKQHINSFHRKIKFKCDICGIELKDKGSIKKHKIREHPPPKCMSCNIEFKTLPDFNLHVQKEHIEKYCK